MTTSHPATLRLRDRVTGRGGDGAVVEVAFTDGVDLSERPGTDPDRLHAALGAVAEATGAQVMRMRQVHGATVVTVDAGYDATAAPAEADALVTARPGVALLARAADCVPVLLADPDAGVVAAVHAGRGGMVAGVAPRAVARMRELGAGEVRAWVGPHVCGSCYEVPEAMREEVGELVPAARAETSWGTPSLDLGAGVGAQLVEAGCEVAVVGGCTREDPAFPSHRRDAERSTRFAGVVWIR